ncbi:PAS domain S-box protein [Candidatus Riflebacteria bacterium]
MQKQILIIEDEINHCELIKISFEGMEEQFELKFVSCIEDARKCFETNTPDLVLSDVVLPDGLGTDLLPAIKKGDNPPLVIMSSRGDEKIATEAMKNGAMDYLVKSPDIFCQIPGIVSRCLKQREEIEKQNSLRQKIRDSEEKFRTIASTAKDAIILLNNDGKIIFWNTAAEKMFGFRFSEIKGEEFHFKIVSGQFQQAAREGFKQFSKTGQGPLIGRTLEMHAQNKEGQVFPVELSISSLKLKGKWNALGIIRDISERKKIEENLKKFKLVVEHSVEMAIITDPDGNIEYANPAFEKYTGYKMDECLGKNPSFLKSGKHSESFYKNLWDTINKGEYWRGQLINRKKNGELYTEEMTITPILNKKGDVTNYVATKSDISEKLKSQKQQFIADKMASLATLVAGVAHEINNPNNFIMMNAPLLKESWEATIPILEEYSRQHGDFAISGIPFSQIKHDIPELLQAIFEGSARIAAIVKNLNLFCQQESSGKKPLDMNQILNDCKELFSSFIQKRTDSFSLKLYPALPPIFGNPFDIRQLVTNLIRNACQALRQKHEKIMVSTVYNRAAEQIIFVVEDEGIGIPPKELDWILDPFYTTKGLKGRGLGLSTCFGIVEDHNGTIEFTSEEGQGTNVVVKFPVMKENRAPSKPVFK